MLHHSVLFLNTVAHIHLLSFYTLFFLHTVSTIPYVNLFRPPIVIHSFHFYFIFDCRHRHTLSHASTPTYLFALILHYVESLPAYQVHLLSTSLHSYYIYIMLGTAIRFQWHSFQFARKRGTLPTLPYPASVVL